MLFFVNSHKWGHISRFSSIGGSPESGSCEHFASSFNSEKGGVCFTHKRIIGAAKSAYKILEGHNVHRSLLFQSDAPLFVAVNSATLHKIQIFILLMNDICQKH